MKSENGLFKKFSLCFVLAALFGCISVTSSTVMIGEARPAIEDWRSVTLTFRMPENAEILAQVRSETMPGLHPDESVEKSFEQLQKAAARVGANVVVIGEARDDSTLAMIPAYDNPSAFLMIEAGIDVADGFAVYVEDCKFCN